MSRRTIVVAGALAVLAVVVALVVVGRGGDGPPLAGELGPDGGIVVAGHELRSTPAELYATQAEGETVVVDRLPPDFNLGAERRGGHVCLRLHPAGRPATTERCDAPAYRDHGDVEHRTFVYAGEVVTRQGRRRRVLFGFTHLAAVQVQLADHAEAADLRTAMPFWMTQFFALPADEGQRAVRFLDADGDEIGRAEIPSS